MLSKQFFEGRLTPDEFSERSATTAAGMLLYGPRR